MHTTHTSTRDCQLEFARSAVQAASRICRAVQSELISDDAIAKNDRSPVTVADFASQALVLYRLREAFPSIPAVAEETSAQLRDSASSSVRQKVIEHVTREEPAIEESQIVDAIDYGAHRGGDTGCHWVLDPIDGTKGFLRGQQYAIALGLIENGNVVLGVLGCPNLPVDATAPQGPTGCLFVATTGSGATQWNLASGTSQPVRTSAETNPANARFCESVEKAHTAQDQSARVATALNTRAEAVRMDSQCKYAAVARGDCEIYLRLPTRADYQECIWDHAAGYMIITEAGGQVTDIHGKPLDFSLGRKLAGNQGIVATNAALHRETLEAVASVINT